MHTKHPTLSCLTCDLCEPESPPVNTPIIPGIIMKSFGELMCLEGAGEFKVLSRKGALPKCSLPACTATPTANSWIKRNIINRIKQVIFYLYLYATKSHHTVLATTRNGVDGTFTALTQSHTKKTKYPTQLWIM